MNNILVKILCGLFLITTISSDGFAGSSDTTVLLAKNNLTTPATVTITKVANIVYPEYFETDKPQYIDYVEKYSNKKRNYLLEMYDKGKNYFPRITPILKKYNLPEELKVLIALESGFNGNAVSRAGAVGYWQMMNESAREYGLKINTAKKDERRILAKSTIAASKYLLDHARMLNNNLLLMVASYNCGMGRIKQALKRSGITNPSFWDIKKSLPKETRNYVMDFIALNIIFANYDKFSKKNLVFTSEVKEVPLSDNANKLNTSITN
ncbi:MAG: lytic transglycosylase domain-containing protein [Ginsengibacter sp.]